MHEKLSQAVKLYDKLLTEQLSRPAGRSPVRQDASSATYAPQHKAPGASAYNQWQTGAPAQVQQVSSPVLQAQTPSYFTPALRPLASKFMGQRTTLTQPYAPSSSPSLTRHNTIATTPSPPRTSPLNRPSPCKHLSHYLTRSNTLAHAHTSVQLQQLQQTSILLPSFPQILSSPPQMPGYTAYSTGPLEPERKEAALLIDL